MTAHRLATFARHNAIALLALFVALGGTGYAATKINGKNIKKGTIVGKALKKNTLTGTQINEAKLGKVPSAKNADTAITATNAKTADNATAVGGVAAANVLKTGCGPGKVNGYAHINGGAASFPSTYTSAAPFIDNTFNCSGQAVEVRREFAGGYAIRFPGNPGTMGFGNGRACVTQGGLFCLADTELDVSVSQITLGDDAGGFQVLVQTSGSSTTRDGSVDVLIP